MFFSDGTEFERENPETKQILTLKNISYDTRKI